MKRKCPRCNGEGQMIDIHGHVQCSICGSVIDDCCQGETASGNACDINHLKTYYIRVRAEYVGYFPVKANNLEDAEQAAIQELFEGMNDEYDASIDVEEYQPEEDNALLP